MYPYLRTLLQTPLLVISHRSMGQLGPITRPCLLRSHPISGPNLHSRAQFHLLGALLLRQAVQWYLPHHPNNDMRMAGGMMRQLYGLCLEVLHLRTPPSLLLSLRRFPTRQLRLASLRVRHMLARDRQVSPLLHVLGACRHNLFLLRLRDNEWVGHRPLQWVECIRLKADPILAQE